jgi:hypothetical protein
VRTILPFHEPLDVPPGFGVRQPSGAFNTSKAAEGRSSLPPWRDCRAFSFVEIMVVVALLSVIILGLMTMFNQTQRAFRLGMSQTDILESGRMASEMIGRELEQITPSYINRITLPANTPPVPDCTPNFDSWVANVCLQVLPGSDKGSEKFRTNVMQDVFFLIRENQTWTGIGYFVRTNLANNAALPGGFGPVGTLFRFETNNGLAEFQRNPRGMFAAFKSVLSNPTTNDNISKVMEGVVDFTIRPSDPTGWLLTNNPAYYTNLPFSLTNNLPAAMVCSNLEVINPNNVSPWYGVNEACTFYSNAVPAAVDLEFGILEQRTYEQYKSIPVPSLQLAFLTNDLARAVSHMHLFRQRISIRNVDHAAY